MGATSSALTPELCREFVTLVRVKGSLKAAAAELGMNDDTLWKRIRPLVDGSPPDIPHAWLEKGPGRKFALTDEGRRMLPLAQEQAERWAAFATAAATTHGPGVAVACGHEAASGVVLAAAASFRTTHPDAAVRIAVARGRQRIEGVASGRYDLALVTDSRATVREVARRPVTVEDLAEDELVLVCGVESKWAAAFATSAPPADVADVRAWPLVLPEADAAIRKRWDELLRRADSKAAPVVAVEVGGWRTLLGYALAGFGVGLVPLSVARGAGAKARVRALADAIRPANKVSVVSLPEAADAPLIAAFCVALAVARVG